MSAVTKLVRETELNTEFELLSTGIKGRIVTVGASLIDDVVATIVDPPIPVFFNEDKQRDEENPLDPHYIVELAATARRRAVAALETMILFGLELDELPPTETWLPRLQLLAKHGYLDLTKYDLDDPLELELLYKKYIAVGTPDLIKIGQHAGLNNRDVEEAARSFKSKS